MKATLLDNHINALTQELEDAKVLKAELNAMGQVSHTMDTYIKTIDEEEQLDDGENVVISTTAQILVNNLNEYVELANTYFKARNSKLDKKKQVLSAITTLRHKQLQIKKDVGRITRNKFTQDQLDTLKQIKRKAKTLFNKNNELKLRGQTNPVEIVNMVITAIDKVI